VKKNCGEITQMLVDRGFPTEIRNVVKFESQGDLIKVIRQRLIKKIYNIPSPNHFRDTFMSTSLPMENPKERFIPIAKQEIVVDLLAATHWQTEDRNQFGDFCRLFIALYHYKFHKHLEQLKQWYQPFNPDTDIITKHDYSVAERQAFEQHLEADIRQLLNKANYVELTIADINRAMSAASFYGVEVNVDLEDFAKMVVYYRGSTKTTKYLRTWKTLFLFQEPFELPIYQRLFVLLRFKTLEERVQELIIPQEADLADKAKRHAQLYHKMFSKLDEKTVEEQIAAFTNRYRNRAENKARRQVQRSRQELPEDLREDQVFIKLFKNIPHSDLKMLFPNQNVRLKLWDKIKLALSGGGGTLFGIFSLITKMTAAVFNPFALVGAFFGLIGIIFRQIMSIFTQRTKYMMTLSRNLYFHSLDNNLGVIGYLLDMAEEEECKEAILAYYFIVTQPGKNYTQELLDREIENYIQNRYGVSINFEVEDGLRKLREEGILREENGVLTVLNLESACACLDKQWDDFFTANNSLDSLLTTVRLNVMPSGEGGVLSVARGGESQELKE
jgi:hypothetical protein